jgi:hypothetical protein
MMGYSLATERETLMREIQAKYDQEVFSLFPGRSAPRYLEGENPDLYRKRLASMALAYAPGLQNIKMDDARGTAFDLIEKQVLNAVASEARHPTQIPEGELREVTRYDAAGRPFIEFYGNPSAWLSQFTSGTKRRLAGIRTQTETGYRPGNLG